jgi:exodeoxyribonuclease VII small subunit
MPDKTNEKPLDYEAAFRRLEEIAALLEQGSLPLDESLKLFEEGAALAARLHRLLAAAEQRVTALRGDADA